MNRKLGYALIFLVAVAGFSIFFFLPTIEGSSGYIGAIPGASASGGPCVIVHLSAEDFAAHPALFDLVVEEKKVRRPTSLFFLPLPGDDWSAIVLNGEEEQALWWTYMFVRQANGTTIPVVLEYNGVNYRLTCSQG